MDAAPSTPSPMEVPTPSPLLACRAQAAAEASLRSALAEPPTRPAAPGSGPGVVLIACGSFSPLTTAHVDMLAHARAHFTAAGTPVHAAVLSPASDGYVASKAATAAAAGAAHRVAMATAAAAEVPWLAVDGVEAAGQVRLPTADAVAGVARRVRAAAGGVPLRPVVVFGVDVVADFTDARKWPPANVTRLLRAATVAVYPRPAPAPVPGDGGGALPPPSPAADAGGATVARLLRDPLLAPHAGRVVWMGGVPPLGGSSTVVRAALASGHPPPPGLLHPAVAAYIAAHRLYGS